jgi:hypothetical protein
MYDDTNHYRPVRYNSFRNKGDEIKNNNLGHKYYLIYLYIILISCSGYHVYLKKKAILIKLSDPKFTKIKVEIICAKYIDKIKTFLYKKEVLSNMCHKIKT